MPVQYSCNCYLLAEYPLVTNFVVYSLIDTSSEWKYLTQIVNAGQRHLTNTSLVDLIRTIDFLYFNHTALIELGK